MNHLAQIVEFWAKMLFLTNNQHFWEIVHLLHLSLDTFDSHTMGHFYANSCM